MSGHCLHFIRGHDIQKVLRIYNHPTKPVRLYGCFDLKPLFLGRLRPEQLTSNQGGQSVVNKLCLEAQAAHLFLQAPTGRGVSEKDDFENTVSDKCCLDSMGYCTWSTLFL